MFGLMKGSMKENGRITRCMAKEYSHGLMGGCSKDLTLMTRNMDMGSLNGLMVDHLKGSGMMVNKTE